MCFTWRHFRSKLSLGLLVLFVFSIGQIGATSPWPKRVRQLEEILREGEPSARRRAALDLADLSESLARRGLRIALKDPDLQVRLNAARVLLALDIRGLSEFFGGWLGSRNQEERLLAVEVLGREPTVEQTQRIAEALSDSEPSVRAAAGIGLGRSFGEARIIARSALMNGLDDSDVLVRIEVASSLGVVGDESVVVALAAHLPDSSPAVRAQLAVALGVIGDPSAIPALLVASSDPEPTVVSAVARALGAIGAPESVSSLIGLARQEPFGEEGRAALEGLAEIGSEVALEELARHLQLPDSREKASELLRQLGGTAVPVLRACFADSLGSHLELCAALALEAGLPTEQLIEAYHEGRLSAESLLSLGLSAPGSDELEVLAIEMLLEGDRERAAALKYLDFMGRSSRPAWLALVSVLKNGRLNAGETAQLLRVLASSEARHFKEAKKLASPFLEATDSAVRAAAARLLVAQGAAGETLTDLIGTPRAEVAGAAAQRLSEGMTPGQSATVIRLLVEGRVGRRSLLLSTLPATPAGLSKSDVANVVALLVQARGADRDAIFGALAHNGGISVLDRIEKHFDRADWLKVAQLAIVHPEGRAMALRVLSQNDPRLQTAALGTLALVGATSEAEKVVSFAATTADGPHFLRAAAYSALAFMANRGIPLGISSDFLKATSCDSPHLALRTASLRLAVAAKLPCPGADLERILLHDKDPLVRRTAAELLRVTSPNSTALRACSAYEVRVFVAEACRRPSLRQLSYRASSEAKLGSKSLSSFEATVQHRGGLSVRPLLPVAIRFFGGALVFVSDRRGRMILPHEEFEVLPPEFAY
jgi:HEAT repeat protein